MKVAVIGGGYAGLAAAVELAHAGIPVTVYESAKTLGGRARRVEYRGEILDNGQHLLLGAYRELLRLMRLVGAPDAALLCTPLKLHVPGQFRLAAPRLPAPLHLIVALLTAQGLTNGERLAAARFMLALKLRRFRLDKDISVTELLGLYGQTPSLRRFLWEPLVCAALNTPPEIASAQVFLNVLRDSFDRRRTDSDMLIPRVDASTLFPESAARFIENRGGALHRATPVRRIAVSNGGFAVSTANQTRHFNHVICAVPPQRIAALTADLAELADARAMLDKFTYQPIYSLYLRYPEHVALPSPLLGLSGGHAQWVFDLGQLGRGKGLLCVVISAAGAHEKLARDDLAQQVHQELQQAFGKLPPPLWVEIIAEKRATFACTPGLQRPPQVTPLPGLLLAGDYTAGDYPATLEGAVRSGIAAAQAILGTS
ncbi:MAG: hydroxysqualene dehydroxylase HpnE [Sulfuricella sp.]|nr:hydroxysqualene dehydroxylase HpnE [Sulfuricella sp.]